MINKPPLKSIKQNFLTFSTWIIKLSKHRENNNLWNQSESSGPNYYLGYHKKSVRFLVCNSHKNLKNAKSGLQYTIKLEIMLENK